MPDMSVLRKNMVRHQIAARGVSDERVLDAMEVVPREAFMPDELGEFAYEDTPLPIEEGQTISQPYIVALMIAAIEPRPDDQVLEIGTGSGYAAACRPSPYTARQRLSDRPQRLSDRPESESPTGRSGGRGEGGARPPHLSEDARHRVPIGKIDPISSGVTIGARASCRHNGRPAGRCTRITVGVPHGRAAPGHLPGAAVPGSGPR